MQIAIIGAGGYIGYSLTLSLTKAGHLVYPLVSSSSSCERWRSYHLSENLPAPVDIQSFLGVFDVSEIDVFLFCYSIDVWPNTSSNFSRNILLPSSVEVLLDHISLIRDSNPLVVYFSTAGQIYTDSPLASSLNIHFEDSPVEPTSLYGLHKYTEELIFRERSHKNFDLKILRLSNVIGPDYRSSNPLCPTFKGFNSLLFSLFRLVGTTDPSFSLFGPDTSFRDYISLDCLSSLVERIISISTNNITYNVSCGRSVSTQQFFDYWLSYAPHSFKDQLQIMTMPHRPDDRIGYIIDNQLLYKDFGYIPSDNLSQILASCWSLFDQSLRLLP